MSSVSATYLHVFVALGLILGQVGQNVTLPVYSDLCNTAGSSPYFVLWFTSIWFVVILFIAVLIRIGIRIVYFENLFFNSTDESEDMEGYDGSAESMFTPLISPYSPMISSFRSPRLTGLPSVSKIGVAGAFMSERSNGSIIGGVNAFTNVIGDRRKFDNGEGAARQKRSATALRNEQLLGSDDKLQNDKLLKRILENESNTPKTDSWSKFLMLNKKTQKKIIQLSFCSALSGITIVFASPTNRTPPYLQAVLGNLNIPLTIIARYFLLRKSPQKAQYLSAAAVITGEFITIGPTIMAQQLTGSFKITSSTTVSPLEARSLPSTNNVSNYFWPIVFALGFIPGAVQSVLEENALKTENLDIVVFLFYLIFWQQLWITTFFWVDILPGYGLSKNFDEWKQHMWNGSKLMYVSEENFFANPTTLLATSPLIWCFVFVACFVCTLTCSGLLLKNTEGAVWQAIVTSSVAPLGTFWWAIFEPKPEFHFEPHWDNNMTASFVGLLIMTPGILFYNKKKKRRSRKGRGNVGDKDQSPGCLSNSSADSSGSGSNSTSGGIGANSSFGSCPTTSALSSKISMNQNPTFLGSQNTRSENLLQNSFLMSKMLNPVTSLMSSVADPMSCTMPNTFSVRNSEEYKLPLLGGKKQQFF